MFLLRRFIVLLFLALIAQSCRSVDPVRTFKNPILPVEFEAGADPAVFCHNGIFYFYSTNKDRAVFTSTNLIDWVKGPSVLPLELKGAWAPEVYFHPEDGRFYMYYTQKYKIGVAVADRPDAVFTDLGFIALSGIDAHMFRDDDSRLYLYFTHTPDFSMHCVPMKSPVETGGPVTKCFEISQAWETNSFSINEGPWMMKNNGTYTLLYSGSDGQSRYYAIGCATAPTPIGPFTKYPDNPVFQDLKNVSGSGHGAVTFDRTGQLWHLYNQKPDRQKGWKRDICMDRVAFDGNGRFSGTPTRGVEQSAPVFDTNLVWIPQITPRGAVFSKPVTVSLSCRTPDVELRYTLDGSEPNRKSAIYTGPFTVSDSAAVKARAFKKGMKDSFTAREKFTRIDGNLVPNPAPDAPPNVATNIPGYNVFPKPVFNWKDLRTPDNGKK
jgi:GH43 family beta-xylosidase